MPFPGAPPATGGPSVPPEGRPDCAPRLPNPLLRPVSIPRGLPALLLLPLSISPPVPREVDAAATPRLVVVISVDQMIPEQLERLSPWWQGGFARFLEEGLVFRRAALSHAHTETGPGHATLGTGCSPARHGIVENDFFDRDTGQHLYCVADETVRTGKPLKPGGCAA